MTAHVAFNDEKELAVASVFQEFKSNRLTGKVEVDFKQGVLVGARKQIVVLT